MTPSVHTSLVWAPWWWLTLTAGAVVLAWWTVADGRRHQRTQRRQPAPQRAVRSCPPASGTQRGGGAA